MVASLTNELGNIMTNNINIGLNGERLVINYLKKEGYSILENNWRFIHKEIDIIALKSNILCIVEVKSRSSDYTSPKDAVTMKKQKNLITAANQYIVQKGLDYDVRFDVAEVFFSDKSFKINYIEDAFVPLI